MICVLAHFFFFNDTATTEIYTLSLHDALPILEPGVVRTTIGGYYVPVSLAKAYETTLGAKPEEPVEADEKSDFPDDSWKNADIKEWASAHEVDLGEATKKADMLAAIQAHKEE